MASSRANSDQSAPLLTQDLQPSTAVGFQQQGTVDWTRVMSGSVKFSVDVLSRLSKAGVETFTVYAARAIFSNVKLGPNGELRLHRALDTLGAFPSFGKALWFGFGVKHIIWSMQESAEGLNCIGICACLAEGYSTLVAAKVVRELFLLYNPPAELTPALRQWVALVESSAGLLASSEFGLVLHGLTKLFIEDGHFSLRCSGSPKDIALVLKEVFEVSAGRLDRLFLSGGADCAWIASVAHWLLDLRVEVQDQDGTIIYRPDGTRSESSLDSQVIITYYQGHSSELLRVNGKHYAIPRGRLLIKYSEHGDIMSFGRVSWGSCLVDTFGSPMRLLLGSQARITGACLGSAARIFLTAMNDNKQQIDFEKNMAWSHTFSPVAESSYGRGFCLLARRLLPELSQNPVLYLTMEAAFNKEYLEAAQQYSQCYTSLEYLCSCIKCGKNMERESEDTTFCLPILISTICTLVRAMSTITIQKDLELQPTRSGLESLYWAQRARGCMPEDSDSDPTYDPVVDGLLKSWPERTLTLAQILFAGREHDKRSFGAVAASHSGLCFCLNTLTEITSDPQRACVVIVVSGKIEWNGFLYDMVRDQEQDTAIIAEKSDWRIGYNALSMTTIKSYDGLTDSSTPGLDAELIIEEQHPENTSISATYRVSSVAFPGRSFSLGAADIWEKLNFAFTPASCEGKKCESLDGFQSVLVKGEGFLLPTPDSQATCLPIMRVLPAKDISVWVALSQLILPKADISMFKDPVFYFHRLQGKQCVRCCVMNTENAGISSGRRPEDRCVSIITSI